MPSPALNPGACIAVPELDAYSNLFIRQTRKGWCQECLGCEAQTEFKIGTLEDHRAPHFYALEESNFCIRCCCPSHRPFSMYMNRGGSKDETPYFVEFERPCSCMPSPCKCCCYQHMKATSSKGQYLGQVTETCWWCIPNFTIENPQGLAEYNVHQPVCFGCCVNCWAEGCCTCRIPFYIYPANEDGSDASDKEVGKIVKVWSGLSKELFTDADNFEVTFPEGCSSGQKVNLVGATFLVNQLFFESDKADGEEAAAGACCAFS